LLELNDSIRKRLHCLDKLKLSRILPEMIPST